MLEFGKREAIAVIAIIGAAVVGGAGWWTLHQREVAAGSITPVFADGSPAKTAQADGTLDIPARGPDQSPPDSSTPGTPHPAPSQIVVFVSGAVKRPDVYSFKPGARIYNAIQAAGGFKDDAQRDALNLADALHDADQIYVPARARGSGATASGAMSVNETGARATSIRRRSSYVPASLSPRQFAVRPLVIPGSALSKSEGGGEPTPAPRTQGRVLGKAPAVVALAPPTDSKDSEDGAGADAPPMNAAPDADTTGDAAVVPPAAFASASHTKSSRRGSSKSSSGGKTSNKLKNPGDGVVNINTASLEELERLPGVGPSMGQRLIDYRTQIGRFASPEQLMDVKGIGQKKFEKMRPFVVVN